MIAALPTGEYRALMLWAKRNRKGTAYDLHFVLENGDRCRATVFFRSMAIFSGNLKMHTRNDWRRPEGDLNVVVLTLAFNSDYPNTNLVTRMKRTSEKKACDIRYVDQDLTFEEF